MISLVRGTAVERLGMVGGLKSETFVFPYRKLGVGTDVRLRAYPIGGPSAFTSENLLVQPGQWVKWTLESDLTQVVSGRVLGDGCHPERSEGGHLQHGPLHCRLQGDKSAVLRVSIDAPREVRVVALLRAASGG